MEDKKSLLLIARIASVMSVLMYVSYIPQIVDNLSGHAGDPIRIGSPA